MATMRLWVLAAVFFWTANALAMEDPVIGYVKTVQGEAMVLAAGETIQAEPGTPLQLGYVLKTGSEGSMGVTLKDNTVMSLGPDTELVVDDYLYSPSKGDLKLDASMSQGSLNYISGVIAKLKPEAVSLKTPAGNIGIRGTHFLVTVEGKD
ncbi:MAG: FecR domain-containing protein [Candidatus Competibacteraceae bacterium]|nr:FecR domain-containing protein [Candidatus Competibacteraceae bacterium]MCB1822392.1 FecR domain-containing protein [Candidatus Competibacteraceae bacterium]HRY14639.1 FecR family protein [Candidatus Competibacteraceae bacterium]